MGDVVYLFGREHGPEISKEDSIFAGTDQDIVWFDICMNKLVTLNVIERVEELLGVRTDNLYRQSEPFSELVNEMCKITAHRFKDQTEKISIHKSMKHSNATKLSLRI